MPNFWLPRGDTYMTAPTLGTLIDTSNSANNATVKLTIYGIEWYAADVGYPVSQAALSAGLREWGWYVNGGNLSCFCGGSDNLVGNFNTIFGSTVLIANEAIFQVNMATGSWYIEVDGVTIDSSATSGLFNVSTGRVPNNLMFIGGRSASNSGGTTVAAFTVGEGSKFGDMEVEVYFPATDTTVTRYYQMPLSGTTITDTVSGQNATLRTNGTALGSDFEAGLTVSAPVIGVPYLVCDITTRKTFRTLSFSYDVGGTPSVVQWRVNGGAWVDVDTFDDTGASFAPNLDVGLFDAVIDVNVDGNTAATTSFDTCMSIMLTGSSSGERMITESSGLLNGRLHIKSRPANSLSTLEDQTITGESLSVLINYLVGATGWPWVVMGYGRGGSRLQTNWAVPAGDAFVEAVNNTGQDVSVILDQVGLNDARANATVTAQNYRDYWSGLRSSTRDVPIITGLSQRSPAAVDQYMIALFQAQKTVIDENDDIYPCYRLDLPITDADNVHLTQAGSNQMALRFANVILYLCGESSYWKGPRIQSATVNGTTVSFTFDKTGTNYTSITPSTGFSGARLLDAGVPITINSTAINANGGTLELAGEPIGATRLLEFAGYDGNYSGSNTAPNYPVDNSSIGYSVDPLFTGLNVALSAGVGGSVAGLFGSVFESVFSSPFSSVFGGGGSQPLTAPTLGTIQDFHTASTGSTFTTASAAPTAGAYTLIAVSHEEASISSISSIEWGDSTPELITFASTTAGGTSQNRIELWAVPTPPSTAAAITITFTAALSNDVGVYVIPVLNTNGVTNIAKFEITGTPPATYTVANESPGENYINLCLFGNGNVQLAINSGGTLLDQMPGSATDFAFNIYEGDGPFVFSSSSPSRPVGLGFSLTPS